MVVLAAAALVAAVLVPVSSPLMDKANPAPNDVTTPAVLADVADAWLAAALAGDTVTVPLREGERTVAFVEEPLLAPGARWLEGDREIPITASTWNLVVLEDALAWGRLTLDQGFMSGLLATSVGHYTIEAAGGRLVVQATEDLDRTGLRTIDGPDTPERGVRVAAPDADGLGYCQGFPNSLGTSAHLATSPTTALVTGWTSTIENIVLDGDKTFYDAGPGTWAARQLAVANVMDGVYNREFNLDVQVVQQHVHTTAAPIDGGDSGTLLDQLRAYWMGNPLDREVVYLFVNKDLQSLGGGAQVIGQAWCIGGAGNPLTHYGMMTVKDLSAFFQQVTMEHEVGHLYAAHHHYANCAEAVIGCTIMINAVDLVFRHEFSSLSRLHIRGWADAHT